MRPRADDAWLAYAQRRGLLIDAELPAPKRQKYGARRVNVDGHWFDSTKESRRYLELKLLVQAHAIDQLELQPAFPLHVMELFRTQGPIRITTIGRYRADFRYRDRTSGEIVVEDTKSDATKTDAYKLRKRLAELIHGIHVREL